MKQIQIQVKSWLRLDTEGLGERIQKTFINLSVWYIYALIGMTLLGFHTSSVVHSFSNFRTILLNVAHISFLGGSLTDFQAACPIGPCGARFR